MSTNNNLRRETDITFAKTILDRFQTKIAEEMKSAIKEIFGPMLESMLQGEMDAHLGYESNSPEHKVTNDRRNGYITKTVYSTMGNIEIHSPRDRDGSFNPHIIPKRSKDVRDFEDRVLAMYAKGLSWRDILANIQDIYSLDSSHKMIFAVTDRVIETAEKWQIRPLKKFYPVVFVNCLYITLRKEMKTKNCPVYVFLGYDDNNTKDILGIWIGDNDSGRYGVQIFDEIKGRGVEKVHFIIFDRVSELGKAAGRVFKDVVVHQ